MWAYQPNTKLKYYTLRTFMEDEKKIFCFSVHKLQRKHSIFHYTFENETSVLHNSIPRNLFISSSWLTWFLHISLSNMIEHVQLSRAHISRFAQTSLVTTWQSSTLSNSWHVQGYPNDTYIPFTYIPLPYLPARHQFTIPPCHVFLITSLLCHYHVCMPWFPSRNLYPQARTDTRRQPFLLHV